MATSAVGSEVPSENLVNVPQIPPLQAGRVGGPVTSEVRTDSSFLREDDPTKPVSSNSKVNVTLDKEGLAFNLWINEVINAAVARNVEECLFSALPRTRGNHVAMSLVTSNTPLDWANRVSGFSTAMEAFEWVKAQFIGGTNREINDHWLDQLDSQKNVR
jgi:hypothetical protein